MNIAIIAALALVFIGELLWLARWPERLAFQLGVGPMPVENFGEPSWLRDLRARQKEAAK